MVLYCYCNEYVLGINVLYSSLYRDASQKLLAIEIKDTYMYQPFGCHILL